MDFTYILLFAAGVIFGALIMLVYLRWPHIKHRLKHRRITLPCATCNGQGYIRPENPIIRQAVGEGQLPPSFPCSKCDGAAVEVHEVGRFEKVEIIDGRIVGEAPSRTIRKNN